MTEPFMPRHHHDDSLDAADPGLGAPGHDENVPDAAELDAQVDAFEKRLDAERDSHIPFHAPTPKSD